LGFGGSEGLRKSNGFWLTAPYPPTVQVPSRAFNANSESLIASQQYLASGDPNETISLAGTGAGPASQQFAYSSPLGQSIPFQGSVKFPTEDAGVLQLSDSNQGFPVSYAAAMIIGILAIVLVGACMAVSRIRAQRSTSTQAGLELRSELATEPEESTVMEEDEVNHDFVWENPLFDATDKDFNDRGFLRDMEEGFRQFG
jgi:hypothetical protein